MSIPPNRTRRPTCSGTTAPTPTTTRPPNPRRRAETALALSLRQARNDPNLFLALCLTDPAGRPLRQAPVHRDLQTFLTGHRRALVELPRDHGKSVQVCGRILWELGKNPALRVKLTAVEEAAA